MKEKNNTLKYVLFFNIKIDKILHNHLDIILLILSNNALHTESSLIILIENVLLPILFILVPQW